MPLVNLKDILPEARKGRYAVGAFNVTTCEMVDAVVEAAERKQAPVIISIAEVHFKYLDLEYFGPYILNRIGGSRLPMALHLDHGLSFDTIVKAIKYGFSSVMIDGSQLPFAENVALTAKVVETARAAGVSVEAELGHVAGGEGNLKEGTEVNRDTFTRPEEAARFVRETGIDALAVAIGTVHGPYKGEPELDFELLKRLREEVNIPLVLHGGSGLSRADFRKAVAEGISKINYYTGNSIIGVKAIAELLEESKGVIGYPELLLGARERIVKNIEEQIETFGTRPCKD
jgi:fructose-bisphosphate aldolase class II